MSSSFNLEKFLGEYRSYVKRNYTPNEIATQAAEQRLVEKAESAVKQENFLFLTLTGKIKETLNDAGIGEMVFAQIRDTAKNIAMGAVNPFLEYLEKNEIGYNETMFKAAIQSDAKQTFFTKQALAKQADLTLGDVGRKFYMEM